MRTSIKLFISGCMIFTFTTAFGQSDTHTNTNQNQTQKQDPNQNKQKNTTHQKSDTTRTHISTPDNRYHSNDQNDTTMQHKGKKPSTPKK